MYRLLIVVLLLIAPLAWTQDAEESDAAQTAEAEDTADADEAAEDLGDLEDLGELYPVEDEDEFIPSEDVAFGQSIPFPTDI